MLGFRRDIAPHPTESNRIERVHVLDWIGSADVADLRLLQGVVSQLLGTQGRSESSDGDRLSEDELAAVRMWLREESTSDSDPFA